ncbi:MAG TPA: sporulation peptidase YabG [Clostridiaceae bacterium]|nr:sporulation peptidase YabG [Clostridiaceae bacterium]
MSRLRVGDIVARKSHGNDLLFKIIGFSHDRGERSCVLRGITQRLIADSREEDLIKVDPLVAQINKARTLGNIRSHETRQLRNFIRERLRNRPGKILHIDSDEDYLKDCLKFYKKAGLNPVGFFAEADQQPRHIKRLLVKNRPDILIVTGHDGIKKNADKYKLESYRFSKFYIESVKQAREFEEDKEKLCVFAGACQSFFEEIMKAGANFASSPGRVLINSLDPSIVGKKVALTSNNVYVTPEQISMLTVSGAAGIGGINTRGKLEL